MDDGAGVARLAPRRRLPDEVMRWLAATARATGWLPHDVVRRCFEAAWMEHRLESGGVAQGRRE